MLQTQNRTRVRKSKPQPARLNAAHRFLLTALSLGSFIGGWGIIARREGLAQSTEAVPPTAEPIILPVQPQPVNLPAPWPTLEPLPALPPIPTVAPLSPDRFSGSGPIPTPGSAHLTQPAAKLNGVSAPIPTLAPLPQLPPKPAIAPQAQGAAVSAPAGSIGLAAPIGGVTGGPTTFEWIWEGAVPANHGFEIMVWRNGEFIAGAHDAVADNLAGRIQFLGNNRYRIQLNIRYAAGVQNRGGDYLWSVGLVQISPSYAGLGIQAPPARLYFDAAGGNGGGNSGGHTTKGS